MASRYPVVTLAAGLALGLALLPATAYAQGNAPAAGSWAMEGGVGGANTASLLKFTTPSSAWLFTVDGSFSTSKQDDSQSTAPSDRQYNYSVNGRLGLRSYRDHDGDVRPFTTFGFLAGGGRSTAGSSSKSTFWNAGGFVELGAVYMFTPHLSLGGVGELNAVYRRQNATYDSGVSQFEAHENAVIVNAGRFRVLAAVYF